MRWPSIQTTKPWVFVLIFVCLGVWFSGAHAQQVKEKDFKDFFYSFGEKVPLTIAADQVGILAREGIREKQIKVFAASLRLRIIREFRGGLFIVGLERPLERKALIKFVREVKRKGVSVLSQAGLVVSVPGFETPSVLTDQFIVGFGPNVTEKEIKAFNAANQVEIEMANPFVKNQFLVRVTEASDLDSLSMANRYLQDHRVRYAYPNLISVFVDRDTVLNDPLFPNQWHHRNTGQGGGTVDADADTSMAWDITQGSPVTLIAVLENGGFDLIHPDLTANLWVNPGETAGNGLDDDGNGFADDINGWDFVGCISPVTTGCGDNNPAPASATTEDHGTAVAGVAAARGNNILGVSGACPNCQIMLLRTGYVSSDWAKSLAFGYAQQMGARIITNSWGGGGATPNTVTAINNATAAGVTVLFAAGNTTANVCTGTGADPRVSLPNVMAVSSSTNQDRKVVFSAIGNCIDILAPSHRGYNATDPFTGTLNITTTDRQGAAGYNNTNLVTNCPSTEQSPPPANVNDYTMCFGGTSSATPLTAGIAGMVLSVNPGLTRLQIQQLLQDTADKTEDSAGTYSPTTGFSSPATGIATHAWGRVNAFEAVRVVAPVALGGRGGVDVFLRDNRLDWGNTEQPSNTLFEATRGFIEHSTSMDIKVDAPPYQPGPTAASFDAFTDETPSTIPGEINRVYVRVRNRGPVTASSVTVKLHWAQFDTALPDLPSDFWTAFPADSSDTSQWHPLSCSGTTSTTCTLTNLAYSGSSVAGTAGDAAQIVQFDFPAPSLDPALPNQLSLLAMIDSAQDPISPNSMVTLVVDDITPNDNNVTHRNYIGLDLAVVLDPDKKLRRRRTTTVRATVTRGGVPQAGETVMFSTADPSVASVSPTSAVTDASGQAQATVRGESRGDTTVTAVVDGVSDSASVKVPDLSLIGVVILVVCMVLFGLLRKRPTSAKR